jgi:penicillin-binding protein 1A
VTDTAQPGAGPDGAPGRAGRRWWLIALGGVVAVGVLGAASVAFAFHRIYDQASIPSEDELVLADPTVVLDADDELVQTLERAAVRENVTLDDLPSHVPDAVLAAEDRRFYEHRGFSIRGIARAAWANVRAGEVVQGASTIHQQYVALAVADIDDSFAGKFREAAVAAKLDDEFDDDRILEMYLNSVPFGRTAYGIQAAARTYFDVDAADLDVEQAATLAGMIAAPTAFDPERNPEGAAARRDFVLGGMATTGALDRERADELLGTELPELRTEPLFSLGPDAYFLDVVRDQLPELIGDDVDVSSGLTVRTTLDSRAQQLAHDHLQDHLGDAADSGAIVSIDPASGAVRTLLGGPDYAEQQFNVAIDGRRQIGSSFKTFALAELVARGYDPDESEVDAPREHTIETDTDTVTVGNYSGQGYGEVSVRHATRDSINTAFVLLADALGHDEVAEMAVRLGIQQEIAAVPSTVLGTTDLSPLEVTAAYATLSAEGVRNAPYLVERVETHDGELLYEHAPDPEEVLTVDEAAVITDVLVDVVTEGTGTAADIGRPVAGKTGTTNEFRDAWFVGYTPELATAVWVGNQDNSPMDGVAGGSIPAATWGTYVAAVLEDTEVRGFPSPDTSGLEPFEDLDATQSEEEVEAERTPAPTPSEPHDEAPEDEAPEDEAREDEAREDDDEAREDDDEAREDDDEAREDDDEAREDDEEDDEAREEEDDEDGADDDGDGDGENDGDDDDGDGNGENDGDDGENDGDDGETDGDDDRNGDRNGDGENSSEDGDVSSSETDDGDGADEGEGDDEDDEAA